MGQPAGLGGEEDRRVGRPVEHPLRVLAHVL